MKILMTAVLLFCSGFAGAQSALHFASPTFDLLSLEAQKDPASRATSAQARADAADGYDGEGVKGIYIQSLKPVGYAPFGGSANGDPAEEPVEPAPAKEEVKEKPGRDSYHFEGRQPVKGINIYTPVKDQRGDEGTSKPEAPANPFKKYMYIAGAAAVALTVAGIFFTPLLFLGGFAAGAAAVLWFMGRKTAGK